MGPGLSFKSSWVSIQIKSAITKRRDSLRDYIPSGELDPQTLDLVEERSVE